MKRILFYAVTLFSLVFLAACDRKHNRDNYDNIDNTPPSAPTGLVITNGDNQVTISWNQNYERDVSGYNVYYSIDYYGKYNLIGSTKSNYYTDYGARNGQTYYYAVTAYDYNGNESDLSKQNANATPRPEGFSENIYDYHIYSSTSGFSFYSYSNVSNTNSTCDFYYDNDNGTPYLVASNYNDIQDVGHTSDIYDIPYAPTTGWSTTGDAVAIIGHTYVIWTHDNFYAKIRISNITNDRIVFDWAFQTVKGNTQLKISNVPANRSTENRKSVNKN
jgi:fibronectin type 3 domain-containing protein